MPSSILEPQSEPPTEAAAIAALGKVFGDGPAQAMWAAAVRAAGLTSPVEGAEQLMEVYRRLTDMSEAMRVVSRSLRIRLIAHHAFARRNTP